MGLRGPNPLPLSITQAEYERRLASGESQASIARSIGVCNDTMTKWRRRWGLPPLRAARPKGVSASDFRWKDRNGYIQIPNSGQDGRAGSRIAEHIAVAEAVAGRRIGTDEVVHHINCRKDDNRPENLLICKRGDHIAYHAQLAGFVADLMERGTVRWTEDDGYSLIHSSPDADRSHGILP